MKVGGDGREKNIDSTYNGDTGLRFREIKQYLQ